MRRGSDICSWHFDSGWWYNSCFTIFIFLPTLYWRFFIHFKVFWTFWIGWSRLISLRAQSWPLKAREADTDFKMESRKTGSCTSLSHPFSNDQSQLRFLYSRIKLFIWASNELQSTHKKKLWKGPQKTCTHKRTEMTETERYEYEESKSKKLFHTAAEKCSLRLHLADKVGLNDLWEATKLASCLF